MHGRTDRQTDTKLQNNYRISRALAARPAGKNMVLYIHGKAQVITAAKMVEKDVQVNTVFGKEAEAGCNLRDQGNESDDQQC